MSDLVVISLERWDEVWRRNQHLVAGLLRTDPELGVLFVEPPADPSYQLTRRERPHRGEGIRAVTDVEGIGPGRLWTFQATKWLPRRIDRRTDDRIARSVVRAAERIGMGEPVLWVNDPAGASVLQETGWPALYDITDDWLAADRPSRELARTRQQEQLLLERCTAVVVCSPGLAATKGTAREVHLVPNAVDVADYRRPRLRPVDLPSGKVALYLGTVHTDRIDLELCARTARAIHGLGTLVLVGPAPLARTDLTRLQGAGVLLLGSKDRRKVPGYLQHADVLVVPHLVNDFTDSLDPIKAYEYRAVGRPVVSTPVAGFREDPSRGVAIAESAAFPEALVESLEKHAAEFDPDPTVPDWAERVISMRRVLARLR